MFSKIAVAAIAFATFAAAVPTGDGQCQTSSQYCCNSVQKASSPQATGIIATLVGAVIGADADVGLTCSPITALGLASNSCTEQPVCCNGNNYKGLVVVGCSPITL